MLCEGCYYCSRCKADKAITRRVVDKENIEDKQGQVVYEGSACEACIKELIREFIKCELCNTNSAVKPDGSIRRTQNKRIKICEPCQKQEEDKFKYNICGRKEGEFIVGEYKNFKERGGYKFPICRSCYDKLPDKKVETPQEEPNKPTEPTCDSCKKVTDELFSLRELYPGAKEEVCQSCFDRFKKGKEKAENQPKDTQNNDNQQSPRKSEHNKHLCEGCGVSC
jgi:hypothetical protein